VAKLPERIGPYRVEERIGSGAMGMVFRVRHPELDAAYALKVLRVELCSANDLARFQREIELLAAVSDHPNVARIHSASHEQGRIYFVMDLVEGEDLERRLTRGPLPWRVAGRYVRDVADAVRALHERGIVHRDIKPANIIVDDRDVPRLTDFGLARAFLDDQNRLTRTGEWVGTPIYMAPEQARGEQVAPGADVYALGMTLYTLVAGQPPIEGESTVEVLDLVRKGVRRPLGDAAPDAPAALSDLVMRCLALEAADRPPAAAAFAAELDEVLQAEGRSARASARRRQLLVAGVVAILLVLAVGAWVGSVLRAGPAPPSLEAVLADTEGAMRAAELRLARPGPPDDEALGKLHGLREQLEAAVAAEGGEPDADARAVLGRLLAFEGQYALRRGESDRARALHDEAAALAAEPETRALRDLGRVHLAPLRGGLAALDPRPDDDLLARMRELERAAEDAPRRLDLVAWRLRVALRAGRADEVVGALDEREDAAALPAGLRMAVWLGAGEIERARALADGVADEALQGRLAYALARRDLEAQEPGEAVPDLRRAVALAPDDPARAELAEEARGVLRQAGRWSRGTDARLLGPQVRREVSAALACAILDPEFELPSERLDALYRVLVEVGPHLGQACVAIVGDLIRVVPDYTALYKLYASLVLSWDLPDPERDLELIEEGLARAEDVVTRAHLSRTFADALYRSNEPALVEFADSVADSEVPDAVKAFALGHAADYLRYSGELEAARDRLERARALAPNDVNVTLFTHALQRAFWEQTEDEAERRGAIEAGWRWLESYEAPDWYEWLPGVCSWLSDQAAADGDLAKAARALELLVRFQPERLRWEARRLQLLCRQRPFPGDEVVEVLEGFPARLEALSAEIEERAVEAEPADPAEADDLSDRAEALLKVETRHLLAPARLEDLGALVPGLERLEAQLLELIPPTMPE